MCPGPDIVIELARGSESLDSDSSEERGGRGGFRSELPSMDVLKAASPCTCRENAYEKQNE